MENRNPNIPPFGGRILQSFWYNHPRQPPPPLHQHFQPQYQSPQSQQPQRRGPYSIATNSHSTNVFPPPPSYRQQFNPYHHLQHNRLPPSNPVDHIPTPTPAKESTEVLKITLESMNWKVSKEAGPFYDYIKKGIKKKKGWLREKAGISTSRRDNTETMIYYDLLLRCAPERARAIDINPHFYHAFDMDAKSLNYARNKRNRAETPSSIMKKIRRTSSTPPPTTTPAPATTNRRVSYSPGDSASKRISFGYTTTNIRTIKTPRHIANATSQLYQDLSQKTDLDSAMKRAASNSFKDFSKITHSGYHGRCDMVAITRLIAPSNVTVCYNECIKTYKEKSKLLRRIRASFKKQSYNGDRHTQNFLAAGVAMTPNCSANSAELFIACARQSLFYQFGLGTSTGEEITKSSMSSATVTNSLANLAASCLNKQLKLVDKADHIFLACDKGHRAGVDHFAKILSFFNHDEDRTEYFTLDLDPAGNADIEAARAVKHSMDQKEVSKKLTGQTTDNGGGATLESFHKRLDELEMTEEEYFVANCTLHNLSLALAVPVEKVFGLGGKDKNNCMQMLHSIFDLQKFYGREVWMHIMKTEMEEEGMDEEAPNKMPQPVTTRWWWLGISCDYAIKYWRVYARIAKATVSVFNSNSYGNIVASSIDALMKEELFYGHTVFLKCYTKFLINPHFEFLQSKGFRSKAAAFNSEAVLVRLFLMYQDFHSVLEEGWKNNPAFDSFNQHLASPRWMTVDQGRQQEKDDETRRANGPKQYEKKLKLAATLQRGIDKEMKKKNDLLSVIGRITENDPSSYWVSMSELKNIVDIDAIMTLFRLHNKIYDEEKKKNRVLRKSEKKEVILAIEPVEKDAFDCEHYTIATRVMKLELRQKQIDLGLKEKLYETFDKGLPDQLTDTNFMNVPLRDLFLLEENEILGDDDVTENSVSEKHKELKVKIATIESDIKSLVQKIKDRDPLPEDDDEAADNDVDQQQQQQQDTDTDIPPTETRTLEEIDTEYKATLSRQATIFIEKAFHAIEVHFHRWTNHLIFYGIAAESPPTSSMVANLILGQTLTHHHNTNTYHSFIHKRDINLDDFATFLQDTCEAESLMAVRESSYYKKYKNGITAIANGEKLWESTLPHVEELRKYIKSIVLANASNQQFVELAIKECMNVTCLNRTVAMKSVIGIIRSYLNREKAAIVEEQLKSHSLHANQHTTGGIRGQREMKNKTKEEDLEGRIIAKGPLRNNALLKSIYSLNNSEDPEEEAKIRRLSSNIKASDENYHRELIASKQKKYDDGRKKQKKINDSQKRRDIELTDVTTGRIMFTRLLKVNIDGVKAELTARGHVYNDSQPIRQLKDLLIIAVKYKDGKQYDKSFHPRTEKLQQQFNHSIRYSE